MATTKTRGILKANIIETNPRQVLLAQYLRDTGNISSQLIGAAEAFYYSHALAADRSTSDSAVELAVSESVLALSGQIMRVLNFHRIDRQIILPNEFLAQCGLVWGATPSSPTVLPPAKSIVTLPSTPGQINLATAKQVKYSAASAANATEDDEEEKDDEVEQVKGINVGGLNASQSVADFLNGTNSR
jgi:hypothetical protein